MRKNRVPRYGASGSCRHTSQWCASLALMLVVAGFQDEAIAQGMESCPAEAVAIGLLLQGAWVTTIETDEGWDGQGTSRFEIDVRRHCALVEHSKFSLDRGDGDLVTSDTMVVYAWDVLTNAWKLLSTDSRGYTHIGLAADPNVSDWTFEILRGGGEVSTRRIVYRGLRSTSPSGNFTTFEWVWQGRENADDEWHERFVSRYERDTADN